MKGIIRHVHLSDTHIYTSFTHHNTTTHVAAYINSSFFFFFFIAEWYCRDMPVWVTDPPSEEHTSLFLVFGLINKAAMSICVQVVV